MLVRLRIQRDPSLGEIQAVNCIKLIRACTNLGLKEAKDIYDATQVGPQFFTLAPEFAHLFESYIREFEPLGFRVDGGPKYQILHELRGLAKRALDADEDEIAEDIMQLILAHKLRMGSIGFPI
jgi:hypothetical protein